MPLLSVCIPAYNRPGPLKELIQSIVDQDYIDFEILICEDKSTRVKEIRAVIEQYILDFPKVKIRAIYNDVNLGYDGNFRKLIKESEGEYCVFMGDDDLLVDGGLKKISDVVNKHEDIGVVLRTWGKIQGASREPIEIFRYFDGDRLFEAGDQSIVSLFRRSVAISGYTVNRELANKYATERFDGTLLYQVYLTGMILSVSRGYYISQLISLMRIEKDSTTSHFFGNSDAERKRFKPGALETEHSLNFIKGMIDIAEHLELHPARPGLAGKIKADLGNYSYPLLSYQVDKPILVFGRYYFSLMRLGLWRNVYIHLYFIALITLGRSRCEKVIVTIKELLNRTPKLGNLYTGELID
ncbi:MAG: hypothetical protein COB04_01295 [Gammaproteobacteria bacterium]|nr:MAG: hypothetical protein COB04_01295 [Gammaproteobacteria bacterium]